LTSKSAFTHAHSCSITHYSCHEWYLPSTTRRIVQSILRGRTIDSILTDLGRRIVGIPKLLEGFQVLRADVSSGQVVEMHRVGVWVGVHPAIVGECGEPVRVVRGVYSATTFVIGGTRDSCEADTADTYSNTMSKK
jgi:hypothetical protein